MRNIFLKILVLTTLVFSLSGCYFFKHREMCYLYSHEAAPLRVPSCVSCVNLGSDCVIPPACGPAPCQPVSILPPGSCIYGQRE